MPRTQKITTRRVTADEDVIDRYVGARIKARRTLLLISQETFGKTIGVTFQQVQKYESGHNRVSASRLHKMASALSCNVGYFFEGLPIGEALVPADLDPMKATRAIELVRDFNRIQAADKEYGETVFALIRLMAHHRRTDVSVAV